MSGLLTGLLTGTNPPISTNRGSPSRGIRLTISPMSAQPESHPNSARVQRVKGAVAVFTPCHGARVLFPPDEAAAGKPLSVICPRDGIEWNLQLVADEAGKGALRPVWKAAR